MRLALLLLASGCIRQQPDPGADVFGHDFQIHVGHVEVSSDEPDGTLWDIDTSGPDPYAILKINNEMILRTATVNNTFTVDWTDQLTRTIHRGDTMEVDVYDSDDFGMGDSI